MLNRFINFKPVMRFKNGSDISKFRGLNNNTSNIVLNLRVLNIVVQ